MNAVRMKEIERGLTGIARKVLAAVSTEVEQNTSQILRTLHESGHRYARDVVEGCLSSLTKSGLLAEGGRGTYVRIKAREPTIAAVPTIATATPLQSAHPSPVPDPVSRLYEVAQAMKGTIEKLREMAQAFALAVDEIENMTLAIEQEREDGSGELKKLRKLRDALKESL